MKREELTALGITDENVDKIMAMNGRDIEKHKTAAEKAQGQVTTLTGQLADRDKDIEDLKKVDAAGLQNQLEALQDKYDTEREAWENEKQQRTYEDRRSAFFSGVEFADDYAKRGVMAEFDERKFQYSEADSTFTGGKEWLEKVKTEHPASFKTESNPPTVVLPTSKKTESGEVTKESFAKMGYREKLALKKDNPELYKQMKE